MPSVRISDEVLFAELAGIRESLARLLAAVPEQRLADVDAILIDVEAAMMSIRPMALDDGE